MTTYSDRYVETLQAGPVPGTVDLWAEAGRYFQQIHSGLINSILEQIQPELLRLGYYAGRETSLQVLERREPDVFVQTAVPQELMLDRLRYRQAAAAVMAEPDEWSDSSELEAIHIKEQTGGTLVTIVEVISPRNKAEDVLIDDYRARRWHMLTARGVNVVEIDATRSVKRMHDSSETDSHPYHIAVFLPAEPQQPPLYRLSGVRQPLKRFALPLRQGVLPVETQPAYDRAYRAAGIAAQVLDETGYEERALPFPSLLTADQRRAAVEQVTAWRQRLDDLRDDR